MWTSRHHESATPPPAPRPSTSSSSFSSFLSSPLPLSPSSSSEQPVYHRVYPDNHLESEYCHARSASPPPSGAAAWASMVDLPYDYTQVEIQSRSIKVIRSPMSLVRSVASRLPTSPYMLARAVTTYARSRSSSPPAETSVAPAPPPPNRPPQQRIPTIEDSYSSALPPLPSSTTERILSSRQLPREQVTMAGRDRVSESGVNWDYGSQGISMLYQTRQGGNAPDLERMNYINSLAYLMKGLPSNLTPAEASTIRQTTPVAVLGPQQGDYFGQESPMPPVQRNWVHSTALILLNWLAALIAWLVPLTRHALLELAQFEKDNQYFSKMALSTLSGVRNAYVWFSSAYAGQVMAAIMGYFFQGVQGAVTEFRTQPVAMRSSSGNYLGQQQQQFSPRQEGKERRQYEQQQHHHQHGYPPQHYTRDFGQLRRQGS